ncbi:hypothetical protein D3C75_474000 [compost metagenome]
MNLLVDYQYMRERALKAKESGEMLTIDPDIMLAMVSHQFENMRIRDIQRDQLKEANRKLTRIKKALE